MFRRTWKQIKILIAVVVIIICIPRSILPHTGGGEPDIDNYMKLNDAEKRLEEYRDDRQSLELKLQQLEIINASRKRFNAKPVKLDILASRVANKMSREAAEGNFLGHWNLRGEKPYHRYAFAGGYDHVSENAYGEWSNMDYKNSPETISSLMKAGHQTFMKEKAPNDGHKKTVINKDHNYVGIGYSLEGKQFRYYEEFIDRYLTFSDIPSGARKGENTSITVGTDGNEFLYFMIVYYEKDPSPMNAREISRRSSYDDFTGSVYREAWAWDLSKYRKGNTYKIPLVFNKEGLYYIQLYTDRKEITRPGSLDTKGKTPRSGIVIKVTG
ncbi:MAG TPA: CAP domain-containing protein [Bacteroidales bacterium]|nr:CAP domain-containing protein [Bacteroidales bacterium]